MRIGRIIGAVVLLALVLGLAVWMPMRTSSSDGDPRAHAAPTSNDQDLAARVSALETSVAALQTAVADAEPTEIVTALVPIQESGCGRPFASWGTATADEVNVQLLQMKGGGEAGSASDGAEVVALEVWLENQGDEPMTFDPADFVLIDCEEHEYEAVAGELDPSLTGGELAPGDQTQGWLTYELAPGAQPAAFVYRIKSPDRTGAEVSCPLVDRDAPPASMAEATGGAGCSATGGNAGG